MTVLSLILALPTASDPAAATSRFPAAVLLLFVRFDDPRDIALLPAGFFFAAFADGFFVAFPFFAEDRFRLTDAALERARAALRTVFTFCFLTVFFLRAATTNSL